MGDDSKSDADKVRMLEAGYRQMQSNGGRPACSCWSMLGLFRRRGARAPVRTQGGSSEWAGAFLEASHEHAHFGGSKVRTKTRPSDGTNCAISETRCLFVLLFSSFFTFLRWT